MYTIKIDYEYGHTVLFDVEGTVHITKKGDSDFKEGWFPEGDGKAMIEVRDPGWEEPSMYPLVMCDACYIMNRHGKTIEVV